MYSIHSDQQPHRRHMLCVVYAVVTKPLHCFKMLRKSQSPLAFSNTKCEIPLLPTHVRDRGGGRGSYTCMLGVFRSAG